jgi:2-polyprenyl-3-methyl-5-hydroxy-6-metoxy-1,4-benzoquinol methylase
MNADTPENNDDTPANGNVHRSVIRTDLRLCENHARSAGTCRATILPGNAFPAEPYFESESSNMDLTEHWNQRYDTGTTPWDSGLPSLELRRLLDEFSIEPCRVLELGCGTGTNAILLAQLGFDVTAVDCSSLAIEQARAKASQAGVEVSWICGDVCSLSQPEEPFPFVFDRGCFHCVRRDISIDDMLRTLERVTAAGSKYIVFTGNANEKREHGPPGLLEADIRHDLRSLCDIDQLHEFYFEDAGGEQGPLGWSCVATRRR